MSKRKIYMHIGFSKTGSSALQFFLNSNPELHTSVSQEKLLYCAFNPDGGISSFKALAGLTKCPNGNYLSHHEIAKTLDLSKTKHDIDKIFSAGYTPMFSHEDWGLRFDEFKKSNFFSELDCSAHMIVYVRPQVEWLNSAWWQWHAWGGKFSTLTDVLGVSGCDHVSWADYITQWRNVPGVKCVTVRLQPQDIVDDFMSLLGILKNPEIKYPGRINVSLSSTLIKLLLRNPGIRGAHDSEVGSILSSILKFDGDSPWIIDKKLAGEIISATHAGNLQLLSMLDEPSKVVMENDPRWWNPDFYASRPFFSKTDFELEKQELLAVVDQAIPGLIQVVRSRDQLAGERDQLARERDQLVRERDKLVGERDKTPDSTSLEITKPPTPVRRYY